MTASEPSLPAGWRLVRYETIGSTNDEAKRLARSGAPHGTLVWAREQTLGRGRRGRAWISPPGNLYLSLILRPHVSPGMAAQLGFVAALAVGEALQSIFPALADLAYKWPNDVLVGGRKIAGILLESETVEGETLAFLVVGVGINLAGSPPDTAFPATSIAEEGLGAAAPAAVLAAFAPAFDAWMRRWQRQGFMPVGAAWRARAAALGRPIEVRLDRATLHGLFRDIDEEGALLLEAAGECRRVAAGEVFPASR